MRDEPEIDAVFATFLGDTRERAPGGPEADRLIDGGVAMRFLADKQQRHGAIAPQAEVEGHPAEHAHHGVDDFHGEAGELHDRDRLVGRLDAEQLDEQLRHRVAADVGVLEHEIVARVVADRLDPAHQPMIVHPRGAVFELAHPLVE